MSPADRLPPSVTPPGGSDKEPYLYPRTERDVAYKPPRTELEPDAEPGARDRTASSGNEFDVGDFRGLHGGRQPADPVRPRDQQRRVR